MSREKQFDDFMTQFFDRLWRSPAYLENMGGLLKNSFQLQQQWNKNLEQVWRFWQLPNQQLQERTLHQLNTLVSEWRFEQEELNLRMDNLEAELAEIKSLLQGGPNKAMPKKAASPKKSEPTEAGE